MPVEELITVCAEEYVHEELKINYIVSETQY